MIANGEVSLGNLDTRRDFTYVDDTVNGLLKGGVVPGIEGRTFNLGTGREISIQELVNELVIISGKPVELMTDTGRLRPEKSEVQRLISDNRQARQTLGWEPAVDLTQGLGRTYQWISKHMSFYQSVAMYQK